MEHRIDAWLILAVASILGASLVTQNAVTGVLGVQLDAQGACRQVDGDDTVQEAVEVFGGRVLCGEEGLLRPIGGVTVGSADLAGNLTLFKRAYNKIVLLEATALEGETIQAKRPITGIVLTGGRHPAPQLLEAAQKADVPLILVRDDTFTALEKWEQSVSRLSPGDETKVRRFTALLDRQGALDRFLKSLNRGYLPRS